MSGPTQEIRLEHAQHRLRRLLSELGYENDPGFITSDGLSHIKHQRHVFQYAFESLSIYGIFCVRSPLGSGGEKLSPIVHTAAVYGADEADEIHRRIWSQGVVPLVLLAMPEGVQIRNGFDFVRGGETTIRWSDIEAEETAREFARIRAPSLRTSLAWRDFQPKPESRIDTRLLSGITDLSNFVRERYPRLKERPDLINTMIGRMLYLFVLVDRGIVDQAWVDGLRTSDGNLACPDLKLGSHGASSAAQTPWPTDQVWALFDSIDAVLNGTIFPIAPPDRSLLTADVVQLIRRVLRYDDRLEKTGQQLGFLDVKFASIRTETILAMYELFFLLQDADTKKQGGAFYTPPYIVDYILDELDDLRPFTRDSIVCDPAAGSGIFVVGAYRRVIERELRGALHGRLAQLSALIVRCIHGLGANPQAASIARFSLYLTMLDYLPGATLTKITATLRGRPLFPPFDENICRQRLLRG